MRTSVAADFLKTISLHNFVRWLMMKEMIEMSDKVNKQYLNDKIFEFEQMEKLLHDAQQHSLGGEIEKSFRLDAIPYSDGSESPKVVLQKLIEYTASKLDTLYAQRARMDRGG